MSHTVIRGEPTTGQLALDSIIDATIKKIQIGANIKKRNDVNLAEIIFYSMQQRPDKVFMINGKTGEVVTYRQILTRSVCIARALLTKGVKGKFVMIAMRNHQQMAALYYAALFADVTPLLLDPNSTIFELRHFLSLVSPLIVFCDHDRYDDVKMAINEVDGLDATEVIADDEEFLKFLCKGHTDDLDDFLVSNVSPESTCLLIPTSGSSGLPKATMLTHRGLIAQLPTLWSHSTKFPQPTELAMLLSTVQWMTHTLLMTTCPVYGVSLLMTPDKPTTCHVLNVIEKFRPTWILLGPAFAKALAASSVPEQLSSLETVVITGAPLTANTATILKDKLANTAHICNGVGLTEMHGFISIPAPGDPWYSNGKIINTVLYKLISEDGKQIEEPNKKGELYLKSDSCVFKGYHNNIDAYKETATTDGWYKTGDVFFKDENEVFTFVERKKFWFKYLNYQIAPEELESVIGSVPGVQESVVCHSEEGPAAAVVLRPGYDSNDVREQIHNAVNSTLSDYKRLRGGIVFVSSLPCTHSGKIKRAECANLVQAHNKNS